jgi:hypothetical protein
MKSQNKHTYRVQHICWIQSERCNKTVSDSTVGPCGSPLEAVLAVRPEEHSEISRYSANDCNGWIGFISNLNHIFMVHPL